MQLTDTTFKNLMAILRETYTDWALSENQLKIWKGALKKSISNELLPRIVSEWIAHESKPPKTPADLINYFDEKIKKQFGNAESESEIIISSARNAYYVTNDFESFTDEYRDSFAAMLGTPPQEAYIRENISKRSSNPKILILVYDEYKGSVKDCFTGDAEHGIEFLRTKIKKNWNKRVDEVVKGFLKSGEFDIKRVTMSLCTSHQQSLLDGNDDLS